MTPHARLMASLSRSRADGIEWGDAWELARAAALRPLSDRQRTLWAMMLGQERARWRASYLAGAFDGCRSPALTAA